MACPTSDVRPSEPRPSLAERAELRRAEARRFLARRGILGKRAAAELVRDRRAQANPARAAAAGGAGSTSLLNQPWQPIGPNQVSTVAYGEVTGRVTAIAADPADATGNTVYLGTTGGGVWKSTNAAGPVAAVAFAPLTDNLPAFSNGSVGSLSIGAITVQPGGTGVLLAGTGDPNDALDSYFGSGVLRSADGGLTWSLIPSSSDAVGSASENYFFFGLAFAGFAWSTQSPNLVVAAVTQSAGGVIDGANERYTAGGVPVSQMGLYYSTDAGQTWRMATITDGPAQVIQTPSVLPGGGGNAATAVVWNPVRNRFYAAVRFHGYYESADGITWTRLANQPGLGLTRTECPANPHGFGSPACPLFRGSLAVQPVTGDLFALTVDVNLLDQGVWQDVCQESSGACASNTVSFGQQLPSAALEDGSGAIELGDYTLSLAAVPAAGDTLLFVGTEDIFRCSLAAGCQFRNTTNTATCAAAQVAPFQHVIDPTFGGTLSLLYFGNDSGLWRSSDNVGQSQPPCSPDDATHFQNLNGGLGSLAEVQELAQDPGNPAILLAGLGVNGDAASATAGQTVWPQVLDGYGSYVAIDPANPQNWYAQSSSGVAIDLCTQGSACTPAEFIPVVGYPQVGRDAFAFPQPAPFVLDPQDSATLILGTCHVWRGPADGVAWSSANLLGELYAGEGPDCDGNAVVQTLAASGSPLSPSGGPETIYAGLAGLGIDGPGAYAGHLFTATIGDSNPAPAVWSDLWSSPVPNAHNGFNPQEYTVSSVIVDPHDPTGQTVYASIQGFDSDATPTPSVYGSTNGGAGWVNLRSNLPDVPVNSLAVDPNDANTLYAALDTGVYVATPVPSCPIQNCWSRYGTGLPGSPVVQLATFNSGGQSLLRAATYGRGIWEIPLITAAATVTTATLAPAALSFASQQVQTQSAAQTITVTNTGTIPMIVTQVSTSGDFSASNNCSTPVAIGGSCTVQVTFTPTATGVRSGSLTIFLNVSGGQITAPLTGNGVPGGAIVLLPTAMNFGSSPIGVSVTPPQNVTVSNTGGVAVNLQTPTVTGDFSIVANTCSASLAPNFGCTVALTFTPTVSGTRSGIFSISDDTGTQTATLSGIGVAPATDTLSPATLSFAGQVVGTVSAPQTVTLTNSGDSPLTEIAVSATGDFQAANGCGNSLIGHASCSVNVTYVPTRPGSESGTLTVNDVYGRPQTVALSGTGLVPPGISALPGAIDFGAWGVAGSSPPQAVTVTNSGGVPLGALTLTITGDFSETTDCPLTPSTATLAAGASCTVQVVFSPVQPGPLSGTLTIASAAPTPSFQVALSGNGLGFSMQAEGASSATIAAGQTATYLLQIDPAAGSIATLTLACVGAPPNSVCTVNPASISLSSGVTDSVTVTIATVAATSSSIGRQGGGTTRILIGWFPAGIFLLGLVRVRRRFRLLAVLCLAVWLPLGCGVSSTNGTPSPSNGNGGGTTLSTTFTPTITATGPGISQSVQLTLIVD
jgi:hypothetical protein